MMGGKGGRVKQNANKEKVEESVEGDGRGKGGQRGSSQVRLTFAGQGVRGDFYRLHLVLLQEAEWCLQLVSSC